MNILTLCDNINLQPKIKSQVVSFSNSFDYIAVIKQLNNFKYYDKMSQALAELQTILGEDTDNIKILACMLKASANVYDIYKEKGISDEIYFATMKCYTRFIDETYRMTGKLYFDRYWWTTRQAGCHLFRIGELEYEMKHIDGDIVIGIHIPSDVDFTPSAMDDSLASAKWFFSKYYPKITLEYYRDNVDTPIVNFYNKIFDLKKYDMQMLDDEWGVLYNHLSDKIKLHSDIEEMLSAFANNNLNQIILSAFKTYEITKYARKFSIEHYFDDVLGTQNIVMESKTIRGRRYMQEHGFVPEQTLYIGDTVHDYNTARDLGVDCILFSGGQQSPRLLQQCGVPVYDNFVDIENQLAG